jgi:hypothetical protein
MDESDESNVRDNLISQFLENHGFGDEFAKQNNLSWPACCDYIMSKSDPDKEQLLLNVYLQFAHSGNSDSLTLLNYFDKYDDEVTVRIIDRFFNHSLMIRDYEENNYLLFYIMTKRLSLIDQMFDQWIPKLINDIMIHECHECLILSFIWLADYEIAGRYFDLLITNFITIEKLLTIIVSFFRSKNINYAPMFTSRCQDLIKFVCTRYDYFIDMNLAVELITITS